jgi:hypothetical protein
MKAEPGDTFGLARWLVGAKVVADGKTLGHVIDLEIEPERGFLVSALELGRFGWIDRLHLLRPITRPNTSRPIRLVDWKNVERLEDGKVYCRAGTKVEERDVSEEDEPEHPSRTASGG